MHRAVAESNRAHPTVGGYYDRVNTNALVLADKLSRPARRTALASLALVAVVSGCAGQTAPNVEWLPDAEGWSVRDVEEAESITWVAYDRDAPGAKVKEIRVVGLVDAEPEVAMQALRHRLTAEEYADEGVEVEVLERSEDEIVTHGVADLPWPLRDREVTERTRFSHDPHTGVFRVEVENVDTGSEVPAGMVRVELVHNVFEVAPTDDGGSVLTASSVHDQGGAFPNGAIYGPVTDGLVASLFDVRSLSAEFQNTASETP